MFICRQKINFMSNRYCKDIAELAILGTLGMLKHLIKNHSMNLEEIFMLICMQKLNFITHFFLKILQRNFLVWLLRAYLATHTRSDTNNL